MVILGIGDQCRAALEISNKIKYVVKHKSVKLFMTYAVGKFEAALNISHLILSASSQPEN